MTSQKLSSKCRKCLGRKRYSAYADHNASAPPFAERYTPGFVDSGGGLNINENKMSIVPRTFQNEAVDKWMDQMQCSLFPERHHMTSRENVSSRGSERSTLEEFYEAEEELPALEVTECVSAKSFIDYNGSVSTYSADDMNYQVVPHMRVPLAPNNTRLDFSQIELQRGLTNVFTATPLARVPEFHCSPNVEETSVLNILVDEIERYQHKEPEQKFTAWKKFKCFTVGANADDFDKLYPWAKYSIKGDQ